MNKRNFYRLIQTHGVFFIIFVVANSTAISTNECRTNIRILNAGSENSRLYSHTESILASKGYFAKEKANNLIELNLSKRTTKSCPMSGYVKRECNVDVRFTPESGPFTEFQGFGFDCYNENSGCFDAISNALAYIPACTGYSPLKAVLGPKFSRVKEADRRLNDLKSVNGGSEYSAVPTNWKNEYTFRIYSPAFKPHSDLKVPFKAIAKDKTSVTMRVEMPEETRDLIFPAVIKSEGFLSLHRYRWGRHTFYLLTAFVGDKWYEKQYLQFIWTVGGKQTHPILLPKGDYPGLHESKIRRMLADDWYLVRPFTYPNQPDAIFFIHRYKPKHTKRNEFWLSRVDLQRHEIISKLVPNQVKPFAFQRMGVPDRLYVPLWKPEVAESKSLLRAYSTDDLSVLEAIPKERFIYFKKLLWRLSGKSLIASDLIHQTPVSSTRIAGTTLKIFAVSGETLFIVDHLGSDWRYGIKINAVDSKSGRLLWTSQDLKLKYTHNLAYENGILVMGGYLGVDLTAKKHDRIVSVDLKTGQYQWELWNWRAKRSKLVEYKGRRAIELQDVTHCIKPSCWFAGERENFPLKYLDFRTGEFIS